MKIGLFDSGIGGLTVLKRLISECPNHEYIYYGDTIHMPYGSKKREEIINYANNIISFFEKEKVDLIIIACGTVSSNKEFLTSSTKLVDIISPLKKKLDKYKNISIIATPLSIKTNTFRKYINTNLNLISCPELVPIIESNNYSNLDNVLKEYLSSTSRSDALLLGCTHYPLIKDYIKKYYKGDIICLDEFIIDIVKKQEKSKFSLKLYFSKVDDVLKNNVKRILDFNQEIIERTC